MVKQKSEYKRSITLIFATDERDNIIRAIINANLLTRLKIEYPYNNGIEIKVTFEDGNIKDLFTLGRTFGALEKKTEAHKLKEKCSFKYCEKCGGEKIQLTFKNFSKNLCDNCYYILTQELEIKNEQRIREREPPAPAEQPLPEEKKVLFKIKFNPNNFKKL